MNVPLLVDNFAGGFICSNIGWWGEEAIGKKEFGYIKVSSYELIFLDKINAFIYFYAVK